ncbi:rhodanese-like domain-containing protein [Microtetraspora sp. NBRC 13810]|uniref:rhodanese-like domain-containing protein n=1 Tax=Microtetraspora sp. NBRC 13810 TaxID=3030990 RepID=UPI002553FE93|nr:rhodanese-like domain-containing protein [Microtetraspora sp. NBRC 13810]
MNIPEVGVRAVPEGAFLLDVREDDEWQAGRAPGATHIPLGQLQQRVDEVPKDGPVYVVCRAGGRSAQATRWLNHVGWEAFNVEGGMQSWAASGLDMVGDGPGDPFVA